MITGHTRLIGLLGSPVAHSISPLMHNEAFRVLGLDFAYLCFDVDESALADAVQAMRCLQARGFNCTMPVKVRMCALADRLSPAARLMDAVNTVVNEDGQLIGHNTDGVGYMASLRDAGVCVIGRKMTLLGCGGAATAIAVQAALDGVAEIALFTRAGRSRDRAGELASKLMARTRCRVRSYDLADTATLRRQLAESCLLTNATPIGMAPNTGETPIPDPSMLHGGLVVSDIIYNPSQTRLLSDAKTRGCRTMNGLPMLLFQGAEAFRLWTGREMPLQAVREACFPEAMQKLVAT